MDFGIIDTHAHLEMTHFDQDREEVIERARSVGVHLINTIGVDLESSRRAIELAEKYPGIVASVGFHPQEASKASSKDMQELAQLAENPHVVAVGELGLDFYRSSASREPQLKVLGWELEIAASLNLPVIIHCRDAQETLRPVVAEWCNSFPLLEEKPRGVLHCFNGDIKTANWYMERGFYISLGAYLGYPSSNLLRDTVRQLPINRLVVETDCPFLPPQQFRGKRNEPSYTPITLGVLAEIHGRTMEEMALHTTQNAKRLFPRLHS